MALKADNTALQVSALAATYQLLIDDGDITRDQLKSKLLLAQNAMEDGSEINACSFEGGQAQAVVMYPKEVVMAAALQVLRNTATGSNTANGADPNVVQADLSRTRIET